MITLDEALALLAGAVQSLPAEDAPLIEADGRVLAEPVHAALDAPRRAVSAMDGYALRDADAAIGAALRVIGRALPGASCRRRWVRANACGSSPARPCPPERTG